MSRRDLAQRYWDAFESGLRPPPGSAARNLERLHQRVAAGEVVSAPAPVLTEHGDGHDASGLDLEVGAVPETEHDADLETAREAVAPRRAAAGLVLLGKSAAASVGIAGAALLSIKLAVVGWTQLSSPPDPAPAALESPAAGAGSARSSRRSPAAPDPAASSSTPSRNAASPAPATAPERAHPAPRSRPRAAPRSATDPATSADRLRAEVELMDRARAALERDDAAALGRMMDEHARRFPEGALREERRAWRAVADCRLDRPGAASQAARFLRDHPRSAQAAKVRRACACDGSAVDRVTDATPSAG